MKGLFQTIRYRYRGDPTSVQPGHLLASKRGRKAYRIIGVTNRGETRGALGWRHWNLVLTVEGVSRAEIPTSEAPTHELIWDRRNSKHVSWAP